MPIHVNSKTILVPTAKTPKVTKGRISIPNLKADRLGTLSFLSWWKRETVQDAHIMVVGAGALGNEVLKNLALMGIGHIFIVDFDTIEMSNLSRSVLFRQDDAGHSKAETATRRLRDINPDIDIQYIEGNINVDVGAGLFRRMDAVIGCLDNRRARWRINELCYRVGVPWVEGAIENLWGKMEVFDPRTEHACYNCSLKDVDFREMNARRSCQIYAQRDVASGKVPTTSTASSIIGAMQVQEALKLIHNMYTQPGARFMFNGFNNDQTISQDTRNPDCEHHYRYPKPVAIENATHDQTYMIDLLDFIQGEMGGPATILLGYDFVLKGTCSYCEVTREIMKPLEHLNAADHTCPQCGQAETLQINEFEDIINRITGREPFLERTLNAFGVPPLTILDAVDYAGNSQSFELTGDAARYGLT